MTRAFTSDPVAPDLVDQLLDDARRAPSAGNSQACAFLVLDRPETVDRYWATTLGDRRADFRWPGLIAAPLLVVLTVRPDAYVDRYQAPDKSSNAASQRALAHGRARLGDDQSAWTVPYWWVDAGAVAQNLLLLAGDAGLGACLFGLFEHESGVCQEFGVDDDVRLVATIALGWPAPSPPGRSASRPRPPLDEVIHRDRWNPAP